MFLFARKKYILCFIFVLGIMIKKKNHIPIGSENITQRVVNQFWRTSPPPPIHTHTHTRAPPPHPPSYSGPHM